MSGELLNANGTQVGAFGGQVVELSKNEPRALDGGFATASERICEAEGMNGAELGGEPITPEGIAALQAEIEQLEGDARTEMAARIKAARELGDLKENADYHIAKEDQAHLETRIKRLKQRLANAVVVGVDAEAECFAFGRTAAVRDESSAEVNTWTLVGSTEADLAHGRLSAESPIGRALRDRKVGELVEIETPRGKRTLRIEELLA